MRNQRHKKLKQLKKEDNYKPKYPSLQFFSQILYPQGFSGFPYGCTLLLSPSHHASDLWSSRGNQSESKNELCRAPKGLRSSSVWPCFFGTWLVRQINVNVENVNKSSSRWARNYEMFSLMQHKVGILYNIRTGFHKYILSSFWQWVKYFHVHFFFALILRTTTSVVRTNSVSHLLPALRKWGWELAGFLAKAPEYTYYCGKEPLCSK